MIVRIYVALVLLEPRLSDTGLERRLEELRFQFVDFSGFRVDALVMRLSGFSGYLLETIARHVCRALEGDCANQAVTETPEVIENFRRIQIVAVAIATVKNLIREIIIEDDEVIMRTMCLFSVLTSVDVTNFPWADLLRSRFKS